MTTIKLRRGTAAQWTSVNPVLAAGEPGFETDTGKEKRGNGTSAWSSLSYFLRENHMDAKYALIGSGGGGGSFTGTADDIVDGITKVVMFKTERTKLSGVAPGATVNASDAELRNRASHTGSQPTTSITGLVAALDVHTTDINALEAAQDRPFTLGNMPIGGLFVVDKAKAFYGAAGSWPATRPSTRLDLVCLWLGNTDPGAIAIAGDIIDLVA